MTDAVRSLRPTGILLVLLLWGMGGTAMAQSSEGRVASLGIQDAPLGQALEQMATAANISLVYDVALVEGRRASCVRREASPSSLLQCLLDDHPIDYVKTSKGTYVLRAAVRRPPQHGQLTGTVRDAEEGRPLVNAHVRLPNAEDFVGTVTDSAGHFRLTGLLPGPHTVVVTHLGYTRHEATVHVPPNATARHDARLASSPIVADSVVIDAARYGPASTLSGADRASAGQLRWTNAAGAPDVLDAANALLGVTTTPPYADLHIQGSASGGHMLRLDGAPVRNPVSVGRLLGAFSPLALEGLTARKAGFGALHGNALSGTLEFSHDLSGRQSQYGTIRIDPRSLDARVQRTTTLKGTPVTAMVAGRTSVWDVYQDAGLTDLIDRWSTLDPLLAAAQMPSDTSLAGGSLGARAQPRVGFYDLHGAVRVELGPAERLYVSGYHGGSHLGADLVLGRGAGAPLRGGGIDESSLKTASAVLPTYDEYAWTNTTAQVRYDTPVGDRTTGTFRAAVSHYRGVTRSETGALSASPEATTLRRAAYGQGGANAMTDIDLKSRFEVTVSERIGLIGTAGLTYQRSRFRLGNAFAPRLQRRAGTVRPRTAVETTVQLGPHTRAEGGLRLTALPNRRQVFVEPRGELRYESSLGGFETVGLNVRGGLYRQFTTQFDLMRDGATAVVPTTRIWMPVPRSMAPPRTYHLAADLTWQPDPHWSMDLEGYRKWQPHLLAMNYPALRSLSVSSTDTPIPARVLGSSHGFAYGGGVRVAYEGEGLKGSARYAYSRARRTFPGRFGGRMTPVPWSEPHRLALNAEVPLGGGVSIEAQGKGVWGRTWGYRRAYYAYLTPSDLGEAWERLRLDQPGTHVLPPRYRLDTGVSLTRSWGGITVKGRLGVANVLDRHNVADWALEPQPDGTVSRWARSLPGRRATMSIRIRY